MGKETAIAWTDHTFNPWWGCEKVSPGCTNCYADTFSHRLGFKIWGRDAGRRFMSEKYWGQAFRWDAEAKAAGVRRRVFCASMADVFEDRQDLDHWRARLWQLIVDTPNLDWLLLTKRPENVRAMVPQDWQDGFPGNVWMGVTVENQAYADKRIPLLIRIPAVIRFVSYEPALGSVVFGCQCPTPEEPAPAYMCDLCGLPLWLKYGIHWIIVGGESGHNAREFDVVWAQDTVEQCRKSGTACFVKQMGSTPVSSEAMVEGQFVIADLHLEDSKGADPAEWPDNLKVQEFPR